VNKGRWAIVIVVLVALGMGVATWPLLRIRRKNEIHRTEAMIEGLWGACEQYRVRNGQYPPKLTDLGPVHEAPLDAWGRPIQYSNLHFNTEAGPRVSISLWSLGPNPDDPSDDIHPERRERP
jgi:hypothetical protein